MRTIAAILLFLCFYSISLAESAVKVKQATVKGEIIKVGQGADIVQSRISADRYVPGNNYGDLSKGYYIDGGATYIITYGPPKSGNGTYVITKIEKVMKKTGTVNKKQQVVHSINDYTAISFDTSESELIKKFPRVKCEQMANPQVRMCTLPVNKSERITYMYFSGKLININGRTKE